MKYELLNWLIDLLSCFAVLMFIYILKIILHIADKERISFKVLSEQFFSVFSDGQAALLVVAYNITAIRSILKLRYIAYFFELILIMMIVCIVYNILMYILLKEIAQMKDGKIVEVISLAFLGISVFSSLIYTIIQS